MSKKKRTTHFYSLLTIITYAFFDPYDESQNKKLEQESLVTFDFLMKTSNIGRARLSLVRHIRDIYPETCDVPTLTQVSDTLWECAFFANGKRMLAQFSDPEPITKRAFLEQQYKKSLIPVP